MRCVVCGKYFYTQNTVMGKGSMPYIACPISIFTVKYFKLSNAKKPH